jgi:hypothetical protein
VLPQIARDITHLFSYNRVTSPLALPPNHIFSLSVLLCPLNTIFFFLLAQISYEMKFHLVASLVLAIVPTTADVAQ